ncbi:glycosyltransferase family 2 protein [Candidatus Pelagibacter sp.]|nr:glycosyltransferase family 2 protein [Candidatus Pelagibacter sp.]
MNPIVTVLVTNHNYGRYLSRCLRSLISQKIDKNLYKIIVIDDASTDNSKVVIDNFIGIDLKDQISCIKNKKKIGLPASLNIGIKKVETRFFVRVDADDFVNENFLDYLINFMQLNKYMDAVAVDYYLVNNKEVIKERVNCLEKPIGCGIIFRTDQIIQLGMYDKNFLLHEDKDLMIRFLKKYKVFRLELPLYRYRQHDKNITKNKKNDFKFSKKLLKKNKIKS